MQPKAPAPRPPENKKKKDILLDVLLGALEEIRTPDLLIRSQTLYPTELPAQVQDIYYHRHRGLSTVFFKKNEFFSRRKKSRRKPRFAAAGPSLRLAPERPPRLLCQTPARPFLHARGGTALSLFFQRAELPSLSPARRRPVLLSPPGAALPAFPYQGQVLFAFPAGGRHRPCLVPGKKARLCPVLPFCRARGKGCTPRQKQKARSPPKG